MSGQSILHVVGSSRFGGGAQIIFPLAARAQKEGWHVDVLVTDPTFKQMIRDSGTGVGIVDLDVIHREIRPFADLRGLWRLTQYLRKHPYTIVHTHTSKAGLIGRIAATLARTPVIVHTVHGFAFHEASSRAARILYSSVERFAAHFCDVMVCVSRFHRDWALSLKMGSPEKVIAIPNGLPPDRVKTTKTRAEMRAELGLAGDEIVLFSAGRLAPQKGFEYLLRSVAQLHKTLQQPFHLILAGEGEIGESLKSLCGELKIEKYVTFLGFRHDVGNLLSAADIVVLPSLWEGLSIALLEAMAAGKPIVTTRIGSNLEVVAHEDTALLVDSKNVEQLTAAIERCVSDPALCEAMARRGAEHFRAEYTYDRMLEQYMDMYRRVLEMKHAEGIYAPQY